jgi:hypothetical protein
MNVLNQRVACVVAVAVLTACGDGSPVKPTGSASVTSPRLVVPAPNGVIRNVDQPVTLTVANSLVTQSTGTTYTFEVATDAAFASTVQTKADVAEGAGGQTSARLDALTPGTDYYGHARASAGGTLGVFGQTYRFTIGPPVVVNAPVAVSPVANASTVARPLFTVTNATTSGPVGSLTYRFEVSSSPAFTALLVDASVPQGPSSTSFQPSSDLPAEATLYWRVSATDEQNGVASPVSAVASFITSQAIDLTRVVYLARTANASGWRQTGTLEAVEQDGGNGAMCMKFTDPGWPDSHWIFGTDPNFGVYANQWYFARIGGIWHGGAGEWIYRGAGSCKGGQGTRTIGPDSGFGEPFSSWVPRVGEPVGYMVTSIARLVGIRRTVDERTNTLVQPWRDTTLGSAFAPTR